MNKLWHKVIRPYILPLLLGIGIGLMIIPLVENKFIFKPTKYPTGHWNLNLQINGIVDCYFVATDGVKLNGWFIPVDSPRASLLICHGNGGNISYYFSYMKDLTRLHVNVFMFDYRGYGKSEGESTEEGVYSDVAAAYQFLIKQHAVDSTKVILLGISLGSAVAIDLATKIQCAGLILQSAPTSVADVAKSRFIPIHLFTKSKFDSINKIKQLQIPILFIHGTDDHLVSISYGRKLFAAANEPKWFYEVQGAGHNDLYSVAGATYLQKMNEFISFTRSIR